MAYRKGSYSVFKITWHLDEKKYTEHDRYKKQKKKNCLTNICQTFSLAPSNEQNRMETPSRPWPPHRLDGTILTMRMVWVLLLYTVILRFFSIEPFKSSFRVSLSWSWKISCIIKRKYCNNFRWKYNRNQNKAKTVCLHLKRGGKALWDSLLKISNTNYKKNSVKSRAHSEPICISKIKKFSTDSIHQHLLVLYFQ